jgi:hypothetical protein
MFKNFSGLLQPYIECDDGSESLYQQCIKIDSIFDFLDLDLSHLTGDRLQEFELLTSLKTCMTLATIHKFCRRGSPKDPKRISSRNAFDKKYEAFFGMALHHWQKACECLKAAYKRSKDARSWLLRLERIAATFAIHLHGDQGLSHDPSTPRSLLSHDLAINNPLHGQHLVFWCIVQQAWSGTGTRGLFSQSEDDGVPTEVIQSLPEGFVEDIEEKLDILPKELKAVQSPPQIESRRSMHSSSS